MIDEPLQVGSCHLGQLVVDERFLDLNLSKALLPCMWINILDDVSACDEDVVTLLVAPVDGISALVMANLLCHGEEDRVIELALSGACPLLLIEASH